MDASGAAMSGPELLSEELHRLVMKYYDAPEGRSPESSVKEEAWNLIADFAVSNVNELVAALSAAPQPAPAVGEREAELVKALEHEQWEIIAGAIKRWDAGERDADYTLGLVHYGFLRLIEAKLAALSAAPQPAPAVGEREAELVKALTELHAVVWGECPSLLNEDSGGDARLDLAIRALINPSLEQE